VLGVNPPRRVAVVTGAARGIGRAVAWQLAAAGWSVVAVDGGGELHDLEQVLGYRLAGAADLDETARGGPMGGELRAVTADVRDRQALAEVVADVVHRHERLDAAVAAAGIIAGGEPLWRTPVQQLTALLEVNVVGVDNLAGCAVPAMLAAPAPRAGRFVAVASAAAHRGLYHLAAYCASKAACVGLVRGLAADLRGTGVTANVVSPGSTRTDMLARTAELYGLPTSEAFAEHALLERLIEPDEVASVVTYLCSGDSGALTGAVLPADGGLTV
jgi:SDR family mycofactocin-dependent oxidoreductase